MELALRQREADSFCRQPFIVWGDATVDQTVTVFDDVPLAGVNPAAYTWISAPTEPGTHDVVGYIDSYQFLVLP